MRFERLSENSSDAIQLPRLGPVPCRPVLLAELDIYHSRPIAPTRRIALGGCTLPVGDPTGPGGLLLGAVAAKFSANADAELHADLVALTHQLEAGRRIPQPRLRHRFQKDRVGLTRSTHRLHQHGESSPTVSFSSADGSPLQYALGAVYAAGLQAPDSRGRMLAAVRRGLSWHGEIGPDLFRYLAGRSTVGQLSPAAMSDPVGWACEVLGLHLDGDAFARDAVQHRYRAALRDAHPDHGGNRHDAATRIADIARARRILMRS